MIDKSQCQTHTRTPWGSRDHRYDYRLRYLVMAILLASFLATATVGVVFIFNRRVGLCDDTKPDVQLPTPPHNAENGSAAVIFPNCRAECRA
ncbi:Uncharacterized protein TCAP_00169 [Tolypocladium capitatum]|uniref:Uncharacterized protein n=1 Tax=Tolypocladium capitatum TaxID=45235 RepID=A0A2K3QQX5_9HYPO|nr:Uncharacterized protein TCAP_00169 [Tolypocladium capitatum]